MSPAFDFANVERTSYRNGMRRNADKRGVSQFVPLFDSKFERSNAAAGAVGGGLENYDIRARVRPDARYPGRSTDLASPPSMATTPQHPSISNGYRLVWLATKDAG
jgi:hypothetical protein